MRIKILRIIKRIRSISNERISYDFFFSNFQSLKLAVIKKRLIRRRHMREVVTIDFISLKRKNNSLISFDQQT